MTSKVQAAIAGAVSGISAFVSWLVMIPPEQQTKLLGPLVELTPIEWRDAVGLMTRGLATVSTFWMVYKASQTGTNLPLPTPPTTP